MGVALCRLPTQLCAGCDEPYPDEDLDVLYAGSIELYCPSCVFDAQKRADTRSDEDYYGN